MRVFKVAWFVRFARSTGITEESLAEAVARAERGEVDARFGAEVIKQRVARAGYGRSGGYRVLLVFRAGERAFFVRHLLELSDDQLAALVAEGSMEEIGLD